MYLQSFSITFFLQMQPLRIYDSSQPSAQPFVFDFALKPAIER